MPNFTEIKETYCAQTDVYAWTDGRTFETGFIRSTLSKSQFKNTSYSQLTLITANHTRVLIQPHTDNKS